MTDSDRISGSQTSTLTIENAGLDDEDEYFVRLANNAPGSTDSAAAWLIIKPAIAHWPFDGDTLDATGNGNDGTIVGDPCFVAGVLDQALQFDGVDDAVATTASLLSNRTDFSIAYWVKPFAGGNRVGHVGQNDAIEFGFNTGTNIQIWTAGIGGTSGGTITTDEWHSIVAAGDSTGLRLYIDGKPAGTDNQSNDGFGASDFVVKIGGDGIWDDASVNGNFFNGLIDEVKILNYAMSAIEAAKMWVDQMGGTVCIGTLPVYDFNGDCITDLVDFTMFAGTWLDCIIYPDCFDVTVP